MRLSATANRDGDGAGGAAARRTQRIGGLVAVPGILRSHGVDPLALLASVGLPPDALQAADRRLAIEDIGPLFSACEAATGCDHFGILSGRAWAVEQMGRLGELLRTSDTLGSAIRARVRLHHLNSQALGPFLLPHGENVDFGAAILHPTVEGLAHVLGHILAAQITVMRQIYRPDFRPTEVHFAHERPANLAPFRAVFGPNLKFNTELSLMRFPAVWLSHPLPGADLKRNRALQEELRAGDALDRRAQFEGALAALLLSGGATGDDLAGTLGLHRRTLDRRLAALDVTFQELLDDVRFDLSQQLLASTHLSLEAIARVLGYAGARSFVRAFRRWSGTTPRRWRVATLSELERARSIPRPRVRPGHPRPPREP